SVYWVGRVPDTFFWAKPWDTELSQFTARGLRNQILCDPVHISQRRQNPWPAKQPPLPPTLNFRPRWGTSRIKRNHRKKIHAAPRARSLLRSPWRLSTWRGDRKAAGTIRPEERGKRFQSALDKVASASFHYSSLPS